MDVMFGLDGILAGCAKLHSIKDRPKDWDPLFAAAQYAPLVEPMVKLAQTLRLADVRLVVCSGRPERLREISQIWLGAHGIFSPALYMRANGDSRTDDVVKLDLYDQILADGFKPVLAIENKTRPHVLHAWQSRGLLALAINGEGEF